MKWYHYIYIYSTSIDHFIFPLLMNKMVSLFELHITMKGPLKKIKIKSQLAFTKKFY